MARKLGYGIREVPVTWEYAASSRVDPLRDTIRMFRDVLAVRWNDLRGLESTYDVAAETAESGTVHLTFHR